MQLPSTACRSSKRWMSLGKCQFLWIMGLKASRMKSYPCSAKRDVLSCSENRSFPFQEPPGGAGSGPNTQSPGGAPTSEISRPVGGRGRTGGPRASQLRPKEALCLAPRRHRTPLRDEYRCLTDAGLT